MHQMKNIENIVKNVDYYNQLKKNFKKINKICDFINESKYIFNGNS